MNSCYQPGCGEIMSVYLFDTNAIQGIATQLLSAARDAGHGLLLSPMSFWELACHLDEENFRLARDNAEGTLLRNSTRPASRDYGKRWMSGRGASRRFYDRVAAQAILDELERSQSYDELMGRQTSLRGRTQRIGDLAENTRNALDKESRRFVDCIRLRCQNYVARYGRQGAMALAGKEFCEAATGLARGLVDDAASVGCKITFSDLADRTLLGAGYAVARACAYIGNVGEEQELSIDGNDMEDYHICLHMGVSSNRTLVTNDDGVRTAFNRTIAAFDQCAATFGLVFAGNARIITPDEFRAEACGRGA